MGARLITTKHPQMAFYLSLDIVLFPNGKDNYIFYTNKQISKKKIHYYQHFNTYLPTNLTN
jgi:hypothetical protein